MENIDYGTYGNETDGISDELLDLITSGVSEYEREDLEEAELFLRVVDTPFILSDNEFDLHEANNNVYEVNVKKVKTVSFTGGNYYVVYDKIDSSKESFVIQGNSEEGYNVFNLK